MRKKYKIGCFIICRMSSSRLPGKALLEVGGKPTIQHVIERAKLMSSADLVVLCTSTEKSDDVIEKIAESNGIECFRGPLNDLLKRFLGAAERFKVDCFAVYTADNLFTDPHLADLGISQMIDNGFDFISPDDSMCVGAAPYFISTPALKKVCKLKKDSDTEYYPKYFKANKEFKVGTLKVEDPIYHNRNIRLTLDYPEDLEFVRRVFDELNIDTNNVSLKRILELLEKKPEIIRINSFRSKDWAGNQNRVLKKRAGR